METLLTSNSKPGDRLAAPPPCDGSRLAVSAHLVGLLHEVDLAELQDDREVDGFLAHSPRFLVEVHLLEDLWRKHIACQGLTLTELPGDAELEWDNTAIHYDQRTEAKQVQQT